MNAIALIIGYSFMALGGLYFALLVSAWLIDRITRKFAFHRFLLEQIGPWLRKRKEEGGSR